MSMPQPDALCREQIVKGLARLPWAQQLRVEQTVDSTNRLARRLAEEGCPSGTAVLADRQTAGRGRLGRSFYSPGGEGLYLSVVLRPKEPADKLMQLTALAAVAACDAVENVCGVRPQIKWTNDLVLGGKKLAGILTELSVAPEDRRVRYAIVGIGVNVHQTAFPDEISDTATSLKLHTDRDHSRNELAAALLRSFFRMDGLRDIGAEMKRYAENCITVGRRVQLVRADTRTEALALAVQPDGSLLVRYDDGTEQSVFCGEVSVRGMYGYI